MRFTLLNPHTFGVHGRCSKPCDTHAQVHFPHTAHSAGWGGATTDPPTPAGLLGGSPLSEDIARLMGGLGAVTEPLPPAAWDAQGLLPLSLPPQAGPGVVQPPPHGLVGMGLHSHQGPHMGWDSSGEE